MNFLCRLYSYFRTETVGDPIVTSYSDDDDDDSDSDDEAGGLQKPKYMSQTETLNELEEIYGTDSYHLDKLWTLQMDSLTHVGYGAFSVVKKGYSDKHGCHVAVKIIKADKCDRKYFDTVLPNEIKLWKELSSGTHENMLMLKEELKHQEFQYLVCELVDRGSVQDLLLAGLLSEWKGRSVFRQLLSAVDYCHKKGIAHRDIKPENLLLGVADQIKLADFSFVTKDNPTTTSCGTPGMMAPEQLVRGCAYDPFISDIWQMGVTLYLMLYGSFPYQHSTRINIEEQIRQMKAPGKVLDGRVFYPKNRMVTRELKHLMGGLLEVEPHARWKIYKIQSCTWLHPSQQDQLRSNNNFSNNTNHGSNNDSIDNSPTA